MLLLAGELCKQDPERVDAFLKEILDRVGTNAGLAERARCVGLIGRILQDLHSWNYCIADPHYRWNLDRILTIFEASGAAREIDFATRLEAAEALGKAGDPRLERENWVKVDGNPFWMGAQKEDPAAANYDVEARNDEAPVHQVEISPFLVGRYPVTVLEFGRFGSAGGYCEEQHWAAGGYGQFTEPGNWQQQLRFPNRPVVEVSWYEAAAYCRWATGRLPTEAEWECAARSGRDGVRYPWGNEDPDEFRANSAHWPAGHVTPVGLYPWGATPAGVDDLAGNVWEWVQDWSGGYSIRDRKNPAGPKEGNRRVLRGGSWVNDAWILRVSDRYRYEPDLRYYNLGFRCARDSFPLG